MRGVYIYELFFSVRHSNCPVSFHITPQFVIRFSPNIFRITEYLVSQLTSCYHYEIWSILTELLFIVMLYWFLWDVLPFSEWLLQSNSVHSVMIYTWINFGRCCLLSFQIHCVTLYVSYVFYNAFVRRGGINHHKCLF